MTHARPAADKLGSGKADLCVAQQLQPTFACRPLDVDRRDAGAVAHPSTYIWAEPISLGIAASGDPRIQAYLIGAVTTLARFLNVEMLARDQHNFWVYTDSKFAADFLNGEGPQYFENYGFKP